MKRHLLLFSALVFLLAGTSSQLLKTGLRITILDELGNIQPEATVTLYPSLEDYRQETNALASSTSDKKGVAKFSDLKPTVYYVSAHKGDKNNIGAGVQTDTLLEGRINKINIVIE